MWDTRPRRIPKEQGGNAKLAGVCEGVGVRYQIDPTIVRIAFVAATLTIGGGLSAYLLGWLVMPRYGMHRSPIEIIMKNKHELDEVEQRDISTGWALLIALVLFSGVLWVGPTPLGSTALGGILVLVLAWWGLHRLLPQPPAGVVLNASATTPEPVDLTAYSYPEGYDTPRREPPAWDPLGTAPFAWDLPEPPPREPEPEPRTHRVWPWVLGIAAIVTVASVATIAVSNHEVDSVTHIVTTNEELQDTYITDIGTMTVDLRELEGLEKQRHVLVDNGIGDTTVYLPEEVPTTLTCTADLGEHNCARRDINPDAPGERLYLEINTDIGTIHVVTPTQ